MRRAAFAAALLASACSSAPIPPAETPYYLAELARASAAPQAQPAGPEAAALREAASKIDVRGTAEAERIRRGDETEALLDVETPAAREFLARLADPQSAEETLAATQLDLERVLLAVYARNHEVAAARANWAASVRMYDQATYLGDRLGAYSAFTRAAMPRSGAAEFPYPGLAALRGEMIDREVAMAREAVRMRLRDVMVAAAKAYHGATHHDEERTIRAEQVALAQRAADAARARVSSGASPASELLETESELAMAENDRAHAELNVVRARGELNTLLDREPSAPLRLHLHGEPDVVTPPLAGFLALARRFSPEVRMARAEADRAAVALRMARTMLVSSAAPGMTSPDSAPGVSVQDAARIGELQERLTSLEHAADEAVRRAERTVVAAHYELDAARRMFDVAAKSTEPLSSQAVDERLRLYESGRGELGDLTAAIKRRLDAAHDVVVARHEYGVAVAMLWMATGARPELVAAEERK